MIGVKRQAPDDTHTPDGLYNSSKRSRSSHFTPSRSHAKSHSSPAPRQRERRLQQTSAPWYSYSALSSAVSSLIRGLVTSETQPATVATRTPSPLKQLSSRFSSSRITYPRQHQEGGGVMGCLSDCTTPHKHQPQSLNRAQRGLEAGERVSDITREADEQDDEPVSIPGPSRQVHPHSQPLRSRSRSSEVVYLGTGTVSSSNRRALGVHPRHGRAYRWENDILEVSDDEEGAQTIRIRENRLKQAQGSGSIRAMEERLAFYRSMEEMAKDDDARQEAARIARSFERAIQDAKAEAKKEQERVSTLLRNGTSSVLDYRAQLDKVRNIKPDRQSSLFKVHDSTPFVPKRPKQPVKPFKSPDDITAILDKLDLKKKEDEEAYRKLSTPAVPKSLSADEQAIVRRTLSNSSFKAPRNGNESIESHNMARLLDGKWLSDDIIGYYIALIDTRNASDPKFPTLHCFNTFFYSKIETGGQASVKRWTKKVDIFSKDLVLIPINVGNMHWIAAAINFKKKRIEYFDSMGKGHYTEGVDNVCSNLAQYLEDEHKDKKGKPYDMSDWTYKYLETAPQQSNGSDCGIFTCQTLELVARGADPLDKGFEFSSKNMPFFRKLMVLEIAQGKLKERW